MAEKTPAEILALKNEWLRDGCWDLADTLGFEDHRQELAEYQVQAEKAYAFKATCDLEMKAIELGIRGNTALAKHIQALEARIAKLEVAQEVPGAALAEPVPMSFYAMGRWIQASELFARCLEGNGNFGYRGKVVGIANGLVEQKINRDGQTICHAMAKMTGSVSVGDVAEIAYHVGGSEVRIDRGGQSIDR